MPDLSCTECSWRGDFSETINDVDEDSDGNMSGEYCLACPECYASTVDDAQSFDSEDLGDTYAS